MEIFLLSFIVAGSLFGIAYVRMRRSYSNKLVSEQDRATALSIAESQLRQKNSSLQEELQRIKDESETQSTASAHQIDRLTQQLSLLTGDQKEIQSKIESLTVQLQHETSQRRTAEEELRRLKDHAGSTTAELHAVIEERTKELQSIQQMLHDESTAHKQIEEILAAKEISYAHTIAELHSTIASLRRESADLSEQTQTESSARLNAERIKQNLETELRTTITLLETQLAGLQAELHSTADALQEQTGIRIATETALQESKEKLYALIRGLEQQVEEQAGRLQEQAKQIGESDDRIRHLERSVYAIINRIPIPVFVVNEAGLCELFNDNMKASVGFSPEDLAGKHFSKFFPEADRSFFEEQWSASAHRDEEFHGETTIVTSTGDTVNVAINFIEIHTGTERKFLGCIYDKTNELAAEHYSLEARTRTEELRQLKSRFLSMVSHQLRSALVTVATNAELLERFVFKWNDEKRYRAFFRINESLKQMMDLLRDVETTTNASADFYKRTITIVNMEQLVQSAAKEALADTGTEHHFILSEQGSINAVSLDEQLTKTIFYHLLSNAFKYSADGQEVNVHIERNDTACVITINDHGIGIPAGEQKYLFTSFFRASNAGNVHGSGLGLTIVQQYVQLAGGTVTLNSVVNKGTSVVVTLPILAS